MTDMHTDTPRREKSPLEELACLDAKGMASEEQRDYLRCPENLFAWKAVLSGLRVDMEAQFTAQ